jgi:hypothetical protein
MKFIFLSLALCFLISCKQNDKAEIKDTNKDKNISKEDSQSNKEQQRIEVKLSFQVDNQFGKKVSDLLSRFLNDLNNNNDWRPYYSSKSLNFVKYPMLNFSSIRFDNTTFIKENPTLISLYKLGSDTIAKIHFSKMDSNNYSNILATLNVGISKNIGEFELVDMFYINSKKLKYIDYSGIEYYYNPSHNFNKEIADQMVKKNMEYSNFFKIEEKKFKYFISENTIEMYKLQGFDYKFDMFNFSENSGLSSSSNKTIFSGNDSEYYGHELVHLYLDEKVKLAGHFWFHEGLATYLSDSRGYDLDWHLKAVKAYFENHKDYDDKNIFELPVMISDYTGLPYAVGGLLCKLTYEKGGYPALFRLFEYGNTNEDFYLAIENELGIKQENLIGFIKNYLENV